MAFTRKRLEMIIETQTEEIDTLTTAMFKMEYEIETLRKETLQAAAEAMCKYCKGLDHWEKRPHFNQRSEVWVHDALGIKHSNYRCAAGAILNLENEA